jgi:exopolysaccharide biosynthesis WecB/TagA/CpsF family protein
MDSKVINKIIDNITPVKNGEEAEALIRKCLASKSTQIISFLNAHGFNLCCREEEFADAILQSDIILRDGIGMQLLFKALKADAGVNMNGTDAIPQLLDHAKGETLGVLGTREPYLSEATESLKRRGHDVIVCENGFKDKKSYLEIIECYKPRIVLLGMGMPKQELVASYLKANTTYNPILINGGAIIDFIGNKVKRAPWWLRAIHAEWVFRLLNEPKRLFKRYTIGNLAFLIRIRAVRETYLQMPGRENLAV